MRAQKQPGADLWLSMPEIIGQLAPAAMHIKLQSGDNQPVTVVVP